MEVSNTIRKYKHLVCLLAFVCIQTAAPSLLSAQGEIKSYKVKDGNMYITLSRNITDGSLADFVKQFNLEDLQLKRFLKDDFRDSIRNKGWKVVINNKEVAALVKPMMSFESIRNPVDKLIYAGIDVNAAPGYQTVYGYNKFRNKYPFLVKDQAVTFYLKNNKSARQVKLAGSFTRWQTHAINMTRTDSGWIVNVDLRPGKYWYKFIVDNDWLLDNDNVNREADGQGNINSVYYKTNYLFRLPGYRDSRRVFLAGSFNEWREKEILLYKTITGWELPVFLNRGTHTYKYIVDGNWMYEQSNPNRFPDEFGSYNSVIQNGSPYVFKLKGFSYAKKVVLSGSFNKWRPDELLMTKTASGWEIPYVLGPGNHEYKFVVDGKWIADPANPITTDGDGNSVMISEPNYTFILRGYSTAKTVAVAGDFNAWNGSSFPMKREGDVWKFSAFLPPGKHRYKFVIDGNWIIDPGNKLWEQNEFGTGNSIIWIETDDFKT